MKLINKFFFIFATHLIFFTTLQSLAQGDRVIEINEFLVFNETNYIDDYGNRSAWIELFNPAYNTVNIARMYITNDPQNPRKYRIPEAGSLTIIEPRGFLILYADNKPSRGVFHLNFILDESGYLAIYDSDGKTLMDEVFYPPQKTDTTYGRLIDGGEVWGFIEKSTPKSSNITDIKETAAERFGRMDSAGFALTIISMIVVFSALIILFFVYKFVGNINQNKYNVYVKKSLFRKGKEIIINEKIELSCEINAAIAMAFSLYVSQTHDYENTTITIKKVSRHYSPWSSKIYGLRNNPKNL